MIKKSLTPLIILVTISAFGQSSNVTTVSRAILPHTQYKTIAGKDTTPALEFGRTYGIFDIGLATGMVSTLGSASDSAHYIEFRPTINIFSAGRFAEGLCLGGGYVFGAKQALMTEICNSINFNISTTVAIAVTQGYYFFDGTNSSRSTQYMGFSLTYNFLAPHSVNKQRKKAAIVKDN